MKLATKSVIPYIIILVVGTYMFSFSMYRNREEIISNKIVEDARENATELAKEIADIYPDTSLETYQEILEKYVDMPNAAYVVLLSVDRNLSFPIYNEEIIIGDMPEKIFALKDVKDY